MLRRLALVFLASLLARPTLAREGEPASLTVKGSDTIGGELGPALARAYEAAHPDAQVKWEGLGSATAFPGLFDGSADLGAASRPVNADELAQAKKLGIALEEFVLGYDGVAIIVNPSNPVSKVTLEEASRLLSGGIRRWAEVRGQDLPVRVVGRPSYSGTQAFVKEKVVRRGRKEGTEEFAPGAAAFEKSEEVVSAVMKDPSAIGYVGMGTLRPGVTVLALSEGEGKPFLRPDATTVRTGTYYVHRPLLLYTRGTPRGATRRLLAFVLGPEGRRIVAAHDFIPSDVPPALEPEAEGEQAAPAAEVRPHVLRVRFDYGEVRLDEAAYRTLKLARAESIREDARLLLIGNADSAGNPEANQRVARIRADAVANELSRLGVPRSDLQVEVRGSTTPLASNRTASGRRENRRVDIELVPRQAP